jgi:shikimate 5-dehydrogenase
VHELRHVYHFNKISRKTRLIGVTGFGDREYLTVAGLNAALEYLDLGARCLPLGVGSARLFSKVAEAVRVAGVVIDHGHQQMLLPLAEEKHPSASFAGAVDLIVERNDKWHGYYTTAQAALAVLSNVIKEKVKSDEPLKGRVVVLVGLSPLARTVAADLEHRGADPRQSPAQGGSGGCQGTQLPLHPVRSGV